MGRGVDGHHESRKKAVDMLVASLARHAQIDRPGCRGNRDARDLRVKSPDLITDLTAVNTENHLRVAECYSEPPCSGKIKKRSARAARIP